MDIYIIVKSKSGINQKSMYFYIIYLFSYDNTREKSV